MKIKAYMWAFAGLFLAVATMAPANEVKITPSMKSVEYMFRGQLITIERNQDPDGTIPAFYAKTSRECPPFCVQPVEVAEGVNTVGELELLGFLKAYVGTGRGFLIDSRTPDFYKQGTIPGAINLPYNLFVPGEENVFFDAIMTMLSGKQDENGAWVFEDAVDLLLFCNGPWCAQSPTAIHNLLAINYPAEKLHYYRGGMQDWVSMGFNTELPGS